MVPASDEPARPWAWALAALAAVGVGGLVVRSRRRREVVLIEDQAPAEAPHAQGGEPEPATPRR